MDAMKIKDGMILGLFFAAVAASILMAVNAFIRGMM